MKRGVLISLALAGLSLFLISAGRMVMTYVDKPTLPEKEVTIALRQIGHKLLLQAGDATSRVLPVTEIEPFTFQLSFQSNFAFVPDSLVKIVEEGLSHTHIDQAYVVNVLDCSTHAIVYGFLIGREEKTTLVPCLGREQAFGCYQIRISFLEESPSTALRWIPLALAGIALLVVSRRKMMHPTQRPAPDFTSLPIGTYTFVYEQRMLIRATRRTALSDKENKLLKIFADNINQAVARERLMKEVWEDEGVIVGRSLDVFVSRLRKKLKDDTSIQLVNIHGLGYSLKVIQG